MAAAAGTCLSLRQPDSSRETLAVGVLSVPNLARPAYDTQEAVASV